MIKTKVTPVPHPVGLHDVVFSEFSFKRYPHTKRPLQFPDFNIHASYSVASEKNEMILVLAVSSKVRPKSHALSFKFNALGLYKCMLQETEGCQDIFDQFASRNAHYSVLWPYVREFIARMVEETGLPAFHIPLVVNWEVQEDGAATATVNSENVTLYFSDRQ